MAAEQIKSTSITNLDSTPIIFNTSAQGATGRPVQVDDWAACSATPLQSTKSFYRIIRFPTGAIVKSVSIATDVGLDSGSHALVMDFNVAWSDSTVDGTPLAFQLGTLGLAATEAVIPTTAFDGKTTTTIAAYSSPNKLFGSYTMSSAGNALGPTDIVFNGTNATLAFKTLTSQPMWQYFGYTDGRGNPVDPGGYFDLIAYVSTAAGTGVAGNIYVKLSYGL
jgi:hypothetical protein